MARHSSARGGGGPRRAQRGRSLSSLPYLPGLDGMRALAVIAVMVYHANHDWLPGGYLGVEVFFVISGYLITLLLIGEHERNGKISLRAFWARRARRLLPALFFMLLLLITYTALFERDTLGQLRGDVLAGLGYASNWYQIWVGQGYTATSAFAPLRHLWSLAVEEQFYLFWPVIMVVLIGRGRHRLPNISRWLIVVAVLITVGVGFLFQPGRELIDGKPVADAFWHVGDRSFSKTDTLYLSTITRSTGLLIGAAFAMIWRPRNVMRGPLRSKGLILDVFALIGLGSLGVLVWYVHLVGPDGADPFLFRGGFLAVGFATVFVIAAVTHAATWTGSLLGTRVLNWVGTRSYGMYLYHWPIYQIIRKAAGNPLSLSEFALAMAITAVITEFSYRFIEMPIRRKQLAPWFERLQARRDPVPRRIIGFGAATCVALFGFASASMATAELKLTDQEVAQQQGQDVVVDFGAELANATTTVAPPPTRPTTSGPTATTTTTLGAAGPASTEAGPTTEAAATTEAPATTEAVDTTEAVETTEAAATTDDSAIDKELSGTMVLTRPTSTTSSTSTTSAPTTTSSTTTTTTTTTTTSTTLPPTVPATEPPTTPAPTEPPTTVPVTIPPTTWPTLPPGTPQVFQAIGDSVMLGAAVNLGERGVAVDATVSRQMRDYVPTVQGMQAAGTLGTTVIVHLGTNGSFSEETMRAFFDALAGVNKVIVLTVHAERGYTARNNELIMTLPSIYPNVQIIDWNARVAECQGNCLYDDGIHLPPDGRRFYAQLIFDAAGL